MINFKDFITKFAAQFELTDPNEITASSYFQELKEWDSLVVLSIIGMIHNSYNVNLKGEDIRGVKTVQDVYNLVISKIGY